VIDFQIVGIMLVKNEDVYIERSIRNIIDFCDKIIITDHQSTDGTFEICRALAEIFPKIDLRSIQSPHESALAIEPYAGTNTWIFGVDGDEIYDPQGLKTMRKHLLNGLFSKDWCIFGNALNVISLDLDKKIAKGHLAPPCRPTSKLYNFSFIEWWINSSERLHGEDIKFKPGSDGGLRRYLHTEISWDQSYFRHLHMPFMKRSTQQKASFIKTRLNPDELMRADLEKYKLARLLRLLRIQVAQVFGFDWKNKKYRRGPLVEKDITQFFQ
jgi:glycosyltransferase involved in cell wall biosynthesis